MTNSPSIVIIITSIIIIIDIKSLFHSPTEPARRFVAPSDGIHRSRRSGVRCAPRSAARVAEGCLGCSRNGTRASSRGSGS